MSTLTEPEIEALAEALADDMDDHALGKQGFHLERAVERIVAARADANAAAVARVEALADQWESLSSRNASAFDYSRWHPAAAKQLRAALRHVPDEGNRDV